VTVRIALDAMGGDHGISVVVPAALQSLKDNKDLHITLVGDEAQLESVLAEQSSRCKDRINIHHASQVVDMDELPSNALRKKKDSSMRVSINLVKEKKVDACVSAGNTGALMATARFVLKTLPGIERPAIITTIPSLSGSSLNAFCHVLDLGANIDVTSEQLFQFAIMGSVLSQAVDGNDSPRIGLLNIGAEEIKGKEVIKNAGVILSNQQNLNYVGFVEADGIFKGDADVVVCDGFDGNVALKSCEGTAHLISKHLKEAFNKNIITKLMGLIALPALRSVKKAIDPRYYNGASLLGLKGIVIKSHGGADVYAYTRAIDEARLEIVKSVPDLIAETLQDILVENKKIEKKD
jgi:phosphate acyltransferase